MNSFGLANNFSSLYPILTDSSPDDSFSEVPYEKGFQFITYLESLFETKEDFQSIIRTYINDHSQQSVTYYDFKASFEGWVRNSPKYKDFADAFLAKVQWEDWVRKPGANPPNNNLNFTTDGAQTFEALADAYIALGGDKSPDNYLMYNDTKDPNLQVIFLNKLIDRASEVTYKLMAKIDADLNVTVAKNPEIGQRWFPLAIQIKYEPAYTQAQHYVSY